MIPPGWGYRPMPIERLRNRRPHEESATHRVIAELSSNPDLLRGAKAADIAERYRVHRSQAYKALARVRQLVAERDRPTEHVRG